MVDSALVQFSPLVLFPDCSEVTRVGVAPEDSDDSEEACGMILCPAVGENTVVNHRLHNRLHMQGPSHKGILQCGCQMSMV